MAILVLGVLEEMGVHIISVVAGLIYVPMNSVKDSHTHIQERKHKGKNKYILRSEFKMFLRCKDIVNR